MQALFIIAKSFFDICLLRKGPQDVPRSVAFLRLVVLVYVASSILVYLSEHSLRVALGMAGVDTLLALAFTYVLLAARKLVPRWVQSCTALFGTGIVFNIIVLPLFYWGAAGEHPVAFDNHAFYLLLIILILWSIAVMAHIFRHALSVPFAVGVLAAILLIWWMVGVSQLLFPQAVPEEWE